MHDKIDAILEGALDADGVIALGASLSEDASARAIFDTAVAQQRVLVQGADALTHVASGVDTARLSAQVSEPAAQTRSVARRAFSITGWAAAAALALILILPQSQMNQQVDKKPTSLAGLSPDQALGFYLKAGLENGQVLGELPAQTLRVDAGEGDQAQVTYVRRIVERRSVQDLYRLGQDELGRYVAVRFPAASVTGKQSL